jgi:hypothetical protein
VGPGAGQLLGNPLACAWPYGYPGLGQPGIAGPAGEPFRVLTTCSWEQSDTMVKVYVPLRGVQTDMLRATFHPTSLEARAPACIGSPSPASPSPPLALAALRYLPPLCSVEQVAACLAEEPTEDNEACEQGCSSMQPCRAC